MQGFNTITCDFCGKTINRNSIAKGKQATLCNLSISINEHETKYQNCNELNDLDICNMCALDFCNYIKGKVVTNILHEKIQNYKSQNKNDNNIFYRHVSADKDCDKVYCTIEDYENEEDRY